MRYFKYGLLALADAMTILIIALWALGGPPTTTGDLSACIFLHAIAFGLWLALAVTVGYELGKNSR